MCGLHQTSAGPCMRRNRVVPMPRRWHQVGWRAMSARRAGPADDGGYQARHSGEIAYKPLDHRAGNAGLFRRTCGDLLACFLHLHARLRVRQTPGIPCALVCFEGAKFMASPGRMASRRRSRMFSTRFLGIAGLRRLIP